MIWKMNPLWFLSILLCFTYASCQDDGCGEGFVTIGFDTQLAEDFNELCLDDRFDYESHHVNSVLTMYAQLDTYKIGDYALDDSVNYRQLFNASDAEQLEAIRDAYHQRLQELFGSHYLNDPSYKNNSLYPKFGALRTQVISFWGKGKSPFVSDQILGKQINKIEKAQNFTEVLHAFRTHRTPPVGR